MTDISCKSRSNGIDTGRPVTEEHDHAERNIRRPKDVLFARSV
jgi:hypothetical protein